MQRGQAQPWAQWQVASTPQPPPYNIFPPGDWKYEMRREAQLIIPSLYLGPLQTAINPQKLQDLGITHILCVRDKREKAMVYERYPDTYKYYILEISETSNEKIINLIPDCMRFMDQAISSGGTVLAHCLSGINLSPALVIAYIMTKYNWNFDHTLSFVQRRRYCVSPVSFEHQLKEYEPIYKATQMYGQTPLGDRKAKRGYAEDEEDEERDESRRMTGWSGDTNALKNDVDME